MWITEVWDSKEIHHALLALPAVKNAMAKGRPLIASFGTPTVTTPRRLWGRAILPAARF